MRTRRAVLSGGVALAAGAALWRFWPYRFEFEPLTTPAGFRQIVRGPVSAGLSAFLGLGDGPPAPAFAGNPCAALFPLRSPSRVPVAVFADVACPFCRRLTPILNDIAEAGAIDLNWHELPLLGPASLAAARAAIAADMQNASPTFRARLMRSRFVPTAEYLAELARSLGLDAQRLLKDAESTAVTRRLDLSRALARLFAVPGTPAMVVGRTLVVGEISRARLEALIALEAEDPALPCG